MVLDHSSFLHCVHMFDLGFLVQNVKDLRDFPGGPVVKTPGFHCRGHGFDPCLGN